MAPRTQAPQQRAEAAAEACRWSEAYDVLRRSDPEALPPEALALFADAAWWCCRVEEEIGLRQRALAGFVAAGQAREAAYAAWMLSVRHGLRGEPVAASGWLQRAQRLLAGEADCVEHGYVRCSEAEQALGEGLPDVAEERATAAVAIGQRFGEPGLVALGLTWQGLCRVAAGDLTGGARLLDEAMTSVVAGELDPHFTGWVYCFAIGICMGVADLLRAGAWARQAWDWASSLPEPTPYQGLCRVRQVEVMCLRGELATAETEARRACQEMLAFEPNLAGEAFYVTGEILRRRGDLRAAETAFSEARDLGHDPQPGVALIRLAQGDVEAATAALRVADPGRPPFQRAALLTAKVEVAVAGDDLVTAEQACRELAAVADEVPSEALRAAARSAWGRVLLAAGDPEAALRELRAAVASWRELDLACEVAETRALIGAAMRAMGDEEGGTLELRAAQRSLERCGAAGGAQRVAELLGDTTATDGGTPEPTPTPLTPRECEVLGLVAAGQTNREIAKALVVSEHTVVRHVSNIFAKLGVGSRAAAVAHAFEHDLL